MPNMLCFCVYVNAGTDMNKSDKNEQTRARDVERVYISRDCQIWSFEDILEKVTTLVPEESKVT